MLHTYYTSATDQWSVFVHTERLNKMMIRFSLSVCTKIDSWNETICDVSMLHIDDLSAADQLSVFVHKLYKV